MRGNLLVCIIVLFSAYVPVSKAQGGMSNAEPAEAQTMLTPDAIEWHALPREWADGPPPLPDSQTNGNATEVAVLQGDPTKWDRRL